MSDFRTAALFAAVLTTGLSAGLFYVWSYSVMPGLARASDRTFVESFQQMNRAMMNGWFALTFGGAFVLLLLAGGLLLGADGDQRSKPLPWLVAALVLYVAMLAITFAINVPMNNELDAAGAVDQIKDLAGLRERVEDRWVRWNNVRSVVMVLSFGSVSWALLQYGRATGKG
ncbi:DUF1772 domain-containing protein [Streptomyces sp. WAC 06738]|uniref:anthrone oxygenase family protein n=1 Tax=Streptomyces sp. WAC 06738 TaxID=2203210 RepID=UPI000F6DB865|nr:DUF1772 domain-containing protein [Streptomyces sp. WAC 06738]AZM47184.1 DUF1772 domain-containing protein [Streptomyces sp. WAC 06738]